ncbi:MAG: M48 family metalloprotease [Pseudobdellovibrionaceae bacterium]|nr:M48 family metalloprotease [Pseudobdellovibrionaceae bacterium]
MNFFEQQEKAQFKTKISLVLFLIAVLVVSYLTGWVIYYILLFVFRDQKDLNLKAIFWGSFFLAFCVILLASLLRRWFLPKDGSKMMKKLGARLVEGTEEELEIKKYRNVVEEMAIASAIPIPSQFILEDNNGINAMTAGIGLDHGAICVTRGALKKLSRDELQALVGHEMGHIISGDMDLKYKLIGYILGLELIYQLGKAMMTPSQRTIKREEKIWQSCDPLVGGSLPMYSRVHWGFFYIFNQGVHFSSKRIFCGCQVSTTDSKSWCP